METATVLWRRLDGPGHDACRLWSREGGWRLQGAAVFRDQLIDACFVYELDFDDDWRTRQGAVQGWLGADRVDWRVARRADGRWTLNEEEVRGLDGCVDLDLGFTPATNLSQIRRVALQVGQAADVPVAWLDAAAGTLDLLQQRYERRGEERYWYAAPRFGYSALLVVGADGFVRQYPELWEAEPLHAETE